MENKDKIKNKYAPTPPLRIVVTLVAICAVVAVMMAAVNAATAGRIEENKRAKINAAIESLFPGFTEAPALDYTAKASDAVKAVYEVSGAEGKIGYCLSVLPKGFGGDIEMMVGTDVSGECVGVRIISISETPGLGSKVNDEAYLSGYEGKSGKLTLGRDIDGIAGATISSKAVLSGVSAALNFEGLFGQSDQTGQSASADPEGQSNQASPDGQEGGGEA